MARKGTWLVLAVLALVLVLGVAALGTVLYLTIETPVKKESFLFFTLEGEFPEEISDDSLAWLIGKKHLSVREVLDALKKASKDERIAGVILDVRFPDIGLGKVQEIRSALEAYRAKTQKPVYAYGEILTDATYYLALAADEIYMPPQGYLLLDGFRTEVPFYRGFLNWLNIIPELIQVEEYKNAADIFMRETMSEPHREATTAILDDLYGQLVRAIAARWDLEEADAAVLVDQGPYWGRPALDAGLVTDLLYRDEFEAHVLEVQGKDPESDELEIIEIHKYLKGHHTKGKEKIAIVVAEGAIVSGESSEDPILGKRMGSDTIAEAFRDIRSDDSIRGVLLRIDSPGGSGLASDIIWRETQLLRNAGVPVVASMSDVAASGGYYIAMGSTAIVAQPATLTGSIGVINGKFVTDGFWREWLHVNHEGIQRGENANLFSGMTRFSEAQAEKVRKETLDFYWQFADKVAQGRGMTRDEVHAVARGRVWSGERALQNGLVDALGGYDEALALLRKEANLPDDVELRHLIYPKGKSFLERLAELVAPRPQLTLEDLTDLDRLIPYLREPILLLAPVAEIR
jgi:protease-4